MSARRRGLGFVSLLLALTAAAVAGPRWEVNEEAYLQMNILGQVHAAFNDDAADPHDIYLRRARIILLGQIYDGLKFFMETDNDNAGRNGTSGVSTDVQDAFVEQRLFRDHYLQGGLILLPFSMENASSAGSLLGLDYNLEVLKFAETFAWRDYGVVFRGDLHRRVAYRAGVFDGYDGDTGTKNPRANLRGVGHLAVSVIGEVETGWFLNQERLADAPYLVIGVGVDHQSRATRIADTNGVDQILDNEALVVDFQSGVPAGPVFATLNGGWYTWDNATFDGDTAFLETGLRHGEFQVTSKWTRQDPEAGAILTDYTVGVHHLRRKHQAKAGLEYRWGDSADQWLLGFQIAL